MSKRPRQEDDPAMDEEPSGAPALGGKGSSSGGNQGLMPGGAMFQPQRPLKIMNKRTMKFTKHFYVKLYANDWIRSVDAETSSVDITGFMTYIPYQALAMYMSPEEYLDVVRSANFAKIKEAAFQMEFKAVRTPFDANATDVAEANGNLQFEVQRWDGLEQVLPFNVVDVDLDGTKVTHDDYTELINRLYGKSLSQLSVPDFTWPATMRERGLTYRPNWRFATTGGLNQLGPLARSVNARIASIPIGEYVTDRLNTNMAKTGQGYCFNKITRPKNGIITMAASAFNATTQSRTNSTTRINTKQRMRDNRTDPLTTESCQYTTNLNNTGSTTVLQSDGSTEMVPRDTAITGEIGTIPVDNLPAFYKFRNNDCDFTSGTGNADIILKATPDRVNTAPNPPRGFAIALEKTEVGGSTCAVSVPTAAGLSNTTALSSVFDCFGYGYENSMAAYTVANLENYQVFTSRNDPPLHHLPSMLIGAIPKTTKQDTIVNATLEFEITTAIEIEIQSVQPTYINCAKNVFAGGQYLDPAFQAGTNEYLYGGKWQHNETDVLLYDPKAWHMDYGRAAKPLFEDLPVGTPTLAKNKD